MPITVQASPLADSQLDDTNRLIAGEMPDLDSDVLLTDDYNPIGYQRRQVQLMWREVMLDYLGKDSLGWLSL